MVNPHTKFLGKNIIFLDEVESTQDYVKDAEKQGAPDGFVVVANHQTKGQGTNGRSWYTKKGENLTFSMLLRPNCNIVQIHDLTIIIAKVIVETIQDLYGYSLQIKKPNDIIINNKKCRRNFN